MNKNPGPAPDLPQQFMNLSTLLQVLGQTILASETPNISQESKERLHEMFDVVLGGLSTYIDKEFPAVHRSDNVLSLVHTPIRSSVSPDNLLENIVEVSSPEIA